MNTCRKTAFLLTLASLPLFGGDLFGTAKAQTTDNIITLGYNSQTASSWWSTPTPQQGVDGNSHSYHAAICLPSSILNKYVGDKIESLQFALSEKNATSVYAFVVSDDLDNLLSGNTLATAITTDFTTGWNTIKLSQPVTIEKGQTLYVGYILTIPASKDVTGIPFETYGVVESGSTFFGLDYNWWDITATGMTYSLPLRALCSGTNVPNGDISLQSVSSSADYYVEKNSEATYTAWVRNYGLEPVQSITFGVEASNAFTSAESSDVTVTGLNIEHGRQMQISIPGINVPVEGDFTVNLTAKQVNGQADPELADNEGSTYGFAWREGGQPVKRTTLLEHFANENYNQGKTVDDCYRQWLGSDASVVWVKHHIATSKFAADQFYLEAEKPYEALYGNTKLDVPFIAIDRNTFSGMEDDGPAYYVADETQFKTMMQSVNGVPSFVALTIDNTLSTDQKTLTTNIGVQSEAYEMPGETDLRLTTWLVEDGIVSTAQKGVNGEYVQNGVLRAIVSEDAWGDAIDVRQYADKKQYTVVLDPSWNVANLRVVSFASNYNQSERKRYVYNTAEAAVSTTDGIAAITGDTDTPTVYDLSGRRMTAKTLPAGIYVFKTKAGAKKMVVK